MLILDCPQSHVFVKKDGTGPFKDFTRAIKGVLGKYLDTNVTPHTFRAMQATESAQAGISPQEHKAMCQGRNHSTSMAEQHYERLQIQGYVVLFVP